MYDSAIPGEKEIFFIQSFRKKNVEHCAFVLCNCCYSDFQNSAGLVLGVDFLAENLDSLGVWDQAIGTFIEFSYLEIANICLIPYSLCNALICCIICITMDEIIRM